MSTNFAWQRKVIQEVIEPSRNIFCVGSNDYDKISRKMQSGNHPHGRTGNRVVCKSKHPSHLSGHPGAEAVLTILKVYLPVYIVCGYTNLQREIKAELQMILKALPKPYTIIQETYHIDKSFRDTYYMYFSN